MSAIEQDVLARAFSMLSALRKNIDQMEHSVLETYVVEYHKVLEKLEGCGLVLDDFRISSSEVKQEVTSVYMDGTKSYTDEKYIDKPFILTKLDAIIGYFEIITSEKPKKMGFRKPNSE